MFIPACMSFSRVSTLFVLGPMVAMIEVCESVLHLHPQPTFRRCLSSALKSFMSVFKLDNQASWLPGTPVMPDMLGVMPWYSLVGEEGRD